MQSPCWCNDQESQNFYTYSVPWNVFSISVWSAILREAKKTIKKHKSVWILNGIQVELWICEIRCINQHQAAYLGTTFDRTTLTTHFNWRFTNRTIFCQSSDTLTLTLKVTGDQNSLHSLAPFVKIKTSSHDPCENHNITGVFSLSPIIKGVLDFFQTQLDLTFWAGYDTDQNQRQQKPLSRWRFKGLPTLFEDEIHSLSSLCNFYVSIWLLYNEYTCTYFGNRNPHLPIRLFTNETIMHCVHWNACPHPQSGRTAAHAPLLPPSGNS